MIISMDDIILSHCPVPARRRAFTLVELLVVVAIIAVLASLLLPALASTGGHARSLQCLANLSALGKSFVLYTSDNDELFPAAFYYRGMSISGGVETPDPPSAGYVHWSGIFLRQSLVSEASLHCPAFDRGGAASG